MGLLPALAIPVTKYPFSTSDMDSSTIPSSSFISGTVPPTHPTAVRHWPRIRPLCLVKCSLDILFIVSETFSPIIASSIIRLFHFFLWLQFHLILFLIQVFLTLLLLG